jgi:serine/threonine protein kinase
MTEPLRHGSLPEAVEDAVLQILEGDDAAREAALRDLLAAHPEHATTIRRWLVTSGVDVPLTVISTDGANTGAGTDRGDDALPHRLGPYVLTALLGRGGFGSVYRAEQKEPIERPVAVKVLNPGMDSREVLARFTAEREALNRMDHPGIARLLDAGTTPKGRPFFVMELVEGPTLINHCRKKRLPMRARLLLFLQVLEALQHAHQKAVLHRDLSSNNVLVADPDGRALPKIIDFGIAKSLSSPLLRGGALTFQGTLMGTPEYMSPEQASGRIDDLDTRADVYALGVQLYELLTDQLPIPGVVLRAQGIAGIADVVRTFPVQKPSDMAPKERRPALRGDLDAIALQALAKSRDERYGTVDALAADLRRHLAHEPVQVASPSRLYRLRKFVRRNRAQSILAGVALLGIGIAFAAMLQALRYAREQAAEAERLRAAVAAKADSGFRLLANEERLQQAVLAERELPPPWPEHAAVYRQWAERHAAVLREEHKHVTTRLAALQAAAANGNEDDSTRHLRLALARLDLQLEGFFADGGPFVRFEHRRALLQRVIGPSLLADARFWQLTVDEIRRSDGAPSNRAYRGLVLAPLPGLMPLGCHPRTQLAEFLDLASHAEGYPWPRRDPATGDLVCDAGTGIVLVLIPGARVQLGARRNQAGMDYDDPAAADDELDGGQATLAPFLIGRTEITVVQWGRLIGGQLRGDPTLPVAGVDHQEASQVLRAFGLLLPTEAQWESACRAGGTSPWAGTTETAAVERIGWFGTGPHQVGLLAPNAFGLFDLHGNVAEWCRDEKLPYPDSTPRRGDGLRQAAFLRLDTELRAVRGGSWLDAPARGRCSARDGKPANWRDGALGLRACRLLQQP